MAPRPRAATLVAPLAALVLAGCTGGSPSPAGPADSASIETSAGPPNSPEPTPSPEPTRDPVRSLSLDYGTSTGADTPVWELGPDGAVLLEVPRLGSYFDYDPVGRRLLFATHEATWEADPPHGGGPDGMAAGDLAILALESGETDILVDSGVMEALWAPDNAALAYVAIQPDTYELRWREPDGSERVLARDVTADWSISPSGDAVAFTRSSALSVTDEPGLFVVGVRDGVETRVSDVDRGQSGSVTDQPVWSPDGRWVAMWYQGELGSSGVVVAAADWSGAGELTIEDSGEWWASEVPRGFLWHPDGGRIVAMPWVVEEPGEENAEAPFPLVEWDIDPASAVLTNGRLVAEVFGLLGWDVPGESVWVRNRLHEPERVPLD